MPSSFGPQQGPEVPKQTELEAKVQKAITEDPEFTDASRITVYFKKGGLFRKSEMRLFGTVPNELEKKRAQELAEYNITKKIVLVNNIKVKEHK